MIEAQDIPAPQAEPAPVPVPEPDPGPWRLRLAVIVAVALLVRLGYVFLYRRHAQPTGDAFYYHFQANLLASGKAFVNPYAFYFSHKVVAAADHPPMWTLVLALAALVGLKSFFSQIIWSCVIGAAAVALVGLAARELAGRRAGLAAAALAALYPTFWINDGALMSETLVVMVTAAIIWLFYRLRRRPSVVRAILLGMACGVAALTRSEMVLLVPLVALGIAVGRTTPGVLIRIGLAAATLLGALVIFAPWWAYNIPRFKEPVLFSSELGDTIEGANCPTTYSGPLVGSWSLACTLAVKSKPGTDPSQQDDQLRHVAVEYAEHHKSRWPAVVAARFGREFGLFHPFGQIDLEWSELGRPRLPATMGLFAFYALAAAAAGGAWILRRRKIPLLPIWAIGADVVLSAIATFGETRYRTGLDVALIVLAGVLVANVDWPLTRRRGDARHAAHRAPPGSDPPAQTATSGPSSTHEPLPLPRG